MPLRDYQIASVEAVRDAIRSGRRRVLLIAPTGSGKSACASEIIRAASAKGTRSLFVVHRRDLVEQFSSRLSKEDIPHGVIMADHERTDSGKLVQIASQATLARRVVTEPGLIIYDEGHHCVADGPKRLLARWPKSVLLGLTASPWRLDGRGLADAFDAAVLAEKPSKLIADGWLSRYAGYAFLAPDLETMPTIGGDYDEGALTLAYKESRIIGDIVGRWLEFASGHKTVLFAPSVETSRDFCAQFRAAGVPAQHVDANSCDEDRSQALERATSGEVLVTCNVGLYTEGTDCPAWSCVILARPTKSTALCLQMLGRVLRPDGRGPEGRNRDKVALIHDHAENIRRHGLPDMERDYSLTASRSKKSAPLPQVTICSRCLRYYAGTGDCPYCGAMKPVAPRTGPELIRDSEAVPLAQLEHMRTAKPEEKAEFKIMLDDARERGNKPGAAVHRFKARFPLSRVPWKVWRQAVKDGAWL